ncbi:MAG: hypothetical protein RBR54_09840 [Sulfurimonas sp.]|nr:hypothetical protein [Sulfurimonas sp.]
MVLFFGIDGSLSLCFFGSDGLPSLECCHKKPTSQATLCQRQALGSLFLCHFRHFGLDPESGSAGLPSL